MFQTDEQLKLIADRLNEVTNETLQAALAIEIFGRGGTEILALTALGSAGIEKLSKRLEDLGAVMSTKDAEASRKFFLALEEVWIQLKAVTRLIGVAIGEAVGPYVATIERAMKSTLDWIKQNRGLVNSIVQITATVGAGAIALGASMIILGKTLQTAGLAVTALGITFRILGGLMTFALSPLGLLTAGLVGSIAAFVYFTNEGSRALAWLKERFRELEKVVSDTIGGVVDALTAGDLKLAMEVLWAGLKVGWMSSTNALGKAWSTFTKNFVQVAAAAFYGARQIWENVSNAIETAWIETTAFLGDVWDGFVGTVRDLWLGAARVVIHSWNQMKGVWDKLFGKGTFDVKGANAAADKDIDTAQQARQKKEIDAAAAREADRLKRRNALEEEHKKTLADITRAEMALSAAAEQNAADATADAQKELDAAQAKLDALRNKAKKEREQQSTEPFVPDAPPKLGGDLDASLGEMSKIASRLQFGGINAELSLGGTGDPLNKIADNTKETNRLLGQNVAGGLAAIQQGAAPLLGPRGKAGDGDKEMVAAAKGSAAAAKGLLEYVKTHGLAFT